MKKKELSPLPVSDDIIKKYHLKRASDMKVYPKVKTGIFGFDYVLDGGIFQGEGGHRIELYGRENSGKTTFTLLIIKTFQQLGKKCVYINGEQSYDVEWASILGVDNSKLLLAEPDNLEQAGDMLADFIGKYDLICMDSIPAIATQEEQEGGLEDKHYASQAKVYSPMMRKLYAATKDFSPTIIFINQLREKVGIVYGNPYNTPGGRALKHFYNSRVEFKIGQNLKDPNDEKSIIGMEILLNCQKNKRGKPHHVAALDFYHSGVIDNKKSLFYAGVKYGVIERKGNTYVQGSISAVGQDKFMEEADWGLIESELWKRIK